MWLKQLTFCATIIKQIIYSLVYLMTLSVAQIIIASNDRLINDPFN
jgi:hypothetical protein